MKTLRLFIIVSVITGLTILLFSVLRSKLIKGNGVFIGAVAGGIAGILISIKPVVNFWLINRNSSHRVAAFSLPGFIFSIIIAAFNFHHPLIVIASASLIGIGAVLAVPSETIKEEYSLHGIK